jgi:hypothetical protein
VPPASVYVSARAVCAPAKTMTSMSSIIAALENNLFGFGIISVIILMVTLFLMNTHEKYCGLARPVRGKRSRVRHTATPVRITSR